MNFSKMMKDPSNNVFGIILLFGVVVLIVVLMKYNDTKSLQNESMKLRSNGGSMLEASGNMLTSSDPSQGGFMDVANIQGAPMDTQGIVPSDLLPRDVNSEWSNVNPASNDLKNLNLLSADQVIGINTVSSSLRNANYQERSEPIIPKKDIGPWGNSTIQPDTFRRPLEIGNQ
jgi:hypothetical protein